MMARTSLNDGDLSSIARRHGAWISVYGSAFTPEFSTSLRLAVRLSDIDVMVVCEQAEERELLRDLQRYFAVEPRPQEPFHKLSVKFRRPSDLSLARMTANELAAVRFGRWFPEEPRLDLQPPSRSWFRQQAILSLRTRWAYDHQRWLQLGQGWPRAIHEAYLACRIVLELPTAILLEMGIMHSSYELRVCRAESLFPRLSEPCRRALSFKLQPDVSEWHWRCPWRAWEFTKVNAKLAGIVDDTDALEPGQGFFLANRPLDVVSSAS